jgi:hypothetical protein
MKSENPIQTKSYAFALRIVKLYRYLCDEKKEFVLSKQMVRSGTSIGANVEEAEERRAGDSTQENGPSSPLGSKKDTGWKTSAPVGFCFRDIIAHCFVAKWRLCDKSSILLSRKSF